MKNTNTNNQTTTTKETANVLNEMQKNVITNFANALKNAIADNYNETTIKNVFKNFADWKKENKDFALIANKVLFANFDNLENARIKTISKINTEKTTTTSEANKFKANTLFLSIDEQKNKVRTMINNAINRNKDKYNLFYSKSLLLATFDTLTDEEFKTLYKGANIVKCENVIALLTAKLLKK